MYSLSPGIEAVFSFHLSTAQQGMVYGGGGGAVVIEGISPKLKYITKSDKRRASLPTPSEATELICFKVLGWEHNNCFDLKQHLHNYIDCIVTRLHQVASS